MGITTAPGRARADHRAAVLYELVVEEVRHLGVSDLLAVKQGVPWGDLPDALHEAFIAIARRLPR